MNLYERILEQCETCGQELYMFILKLSNLPLLLSEALGSGRVGLVDAAGQRVDLEC